MIPGYLGLHIWRLSRGAFEISLRTKIGGTLDYVKLFVIPNLNKIYCKIVY